MASDDSHDQWQSSRRALLASLLAAGSLGAVLRWEDLEAAASTARRAPSPAALTPGEFADVDALVGLIIPADETPGAREAGVPNFIDAALGRLFLARATEFRAGLADFQARARAARPAGGAFAIWPPATQAEFLATVEQTPFFHLLRDLTVLGLLAMPEYGGNRDGIGWKLIGFVDQHAFSPPFGYYDRDYEGFGSTPPERA